MMSTLEMTRMQAFCDNPELRTTVSVEFEVFGQVQGTFFTKYCKETADRLGICGWVKNSKRCTVLGKIQGRREKVDEMAYWLTKTGSPHCKITTCQFTNWESLAQSDFRGFRVRY